MGWEDRNGRQYYYRKCRFGKKVFSEYVGSGFLAELIAEEDEIKSMNRKEVQDAWGLEKTIQMVIDSEVESAIDLSKTFIRAYLLLAGYHPHKGQWRKKRNG